MPLKVHTYPDIQLHPPVAADIDQHSRFIERSQGVIGCTGWQKRWQWWWRWWGRQGQGQGRWRRRQGWGQGRWGRRGQVSYLWLWNTRHFPHPGVIPADLYQVIPSTLQMKGSQISYCEGNVAGRKIMSALQIKFNSSQMMYHNKQLLTSLSTLQPDAIHNISIQIYPYLTKIHQSTWGHPQCACLFAQWTAWSDLEGVWVSGLGCGFVVSSIFF